MIARLMLGAGGALAAVAVFANPPLTAAWLPGTVLLVAGWRRRLDEPARAARRRRAARRGWLNG